MEHGQVWVNVLAIGNISSIGVYRLVLSENGDQMKRTCETCKHCSDIWELCKAGYNRVFVTDTRSICAGYKKENQVKQTTN